MDGAIGPLFAEPVPANTEAEAGRTQSLLPVLCLNSSHALRRNDVKINATDRRAVRSQIMRISCVQRDSSTTSRDFESRSLQ
jgi:hypothetical protein